MIYQIDIHTDRISIIVHLQDEEEFFWIIPIENDGSDKWVTVQAWLDEGNVIGDTIEHLTLYRDTRKVAYAELNQDEMRYDDMVNGTNTWGEAIEAIKAKYPKPGET
jgi:hypothetical protein